MKIKQEYLILAFFLTSCGGNPVEVKGGADNKREDEEEASGFDGSLPDNDYGYKNDGAGAKDTDDLPDEDAGDEDLPDLSDASDIKDAEENDDAESDDSDDTDDTETTDTEPEDIEDVEDSDIEDSNIDEDAGETDIGDAEDTGDFDVGEDAGETDTGEPDAGKEPCNPAPDCSAFDSQCSIGVCDPQKDKCVAVFKENNTPCDADGDGCTFNDSCQNGLCKPGTTGPDCSRYGDECNKGVCQSAGPNSYRCVTSPRPNGTPCNADNNGCTSGDFCQGGDCYQGDIVTCASVPLGQCDEKAVCQSKGAEDYECKKVFKADGTLCDDGKFCLMDETCQAGLCQGSSRDCSAFSDSCNEGLCDEDQDICYANPIFPDADFDGYLDALCCPLGEVCAGKPGGDCDDSNPDAYPNRPDDPIEVEVLEDVLLDDLAGDGNDVDIAVDADGYPYIAYHCKDNPATNCILSYSEETRFIKKGAEGWSSIFVMAGFSPKMRLDSQGNAFIFQHDMMSYCYSYWKQDILGNWEDGTGFYCDADGYISRKWDILFDSADKLHFLYFDQWNLTRHYVTNQSGSYQAFAIDTGRNARDGMRLTQTPDGKLHAVLIDGDVNLRYSTNESGAWVTETILPSFGPWGSRIVGFVSDPLGALQLFAYGNEQQDADEPRHLQRNINDWQELTPFSYIRSNPDFDSQGNWHVLATPQKYGYSQYLTNLSGAWQYYPLRNGGRLAVDSQGLVHIAILDWNVNTNSVELHYLKLRPSNAADENCDGK